MSNKYKSIPPRFHQTLSFIESSLPKGSKILDLGTPNELSEFMTENGYEVDNAFGKDFDLEPTIVAQDGYDAVTMLEVLEHLVNPMGVLQEVKAPKLFASVPLDLWFSKDYKNQSNEWDQHFHEFEDWQFDWLLRKSGWKKLRSEKWVNPTNKLGIRPLLRRFTPRFYMIEAIRL